MSAESYSHAFSPAQHQHLPAVPGRDKSSVSSVVTLSTVRPGHTGHNINIRLVTIMWESSPTAGSILYIPQKFGHISHVMCAVAVPTCETCARDRRYFVQLTIGIGVDSGDCKKLVKALFPSRRKCHRLCPLAHVPSLHSVSLAARRHRMFPPSAPRNPSQPYFPKLSTASPPLIRIC